jgi:Uma2 family endonuclease
MAKGTIDGFKWHQNLTEDMSTVANFSLDQYERMVQAGAFDGRLRQQVEFIRGEIREMNPIGSYHAQILGDLTDWSYDVTPRGEISIRVQTTLRIPSCNSAPQPDLIWVKRRRYSRKHPEAADVLLLVEVAESTLAEDRGDKQELYAEAMIAEYWIVNLLNRTIEVYRNPTGGAYQWAQVFGAGEAVAPLALPQASLPVNYLFVE